MFSSRIEDLYEFNNDITLICDDVSAYFEPIKIIIDRLNEQNSKFFFLKYLFGSVFKLFPNENSLFLSFCVCVCRLTVKTDEIEIEQLVKQYLERVSNRCGIHIVKLLLFNRQIFEDCNEDSQQLQLEGFETMVENGYRKLKTVLQQRRKAQNLLQIMSLYKLEDESVCELCQSLAELFTFQLKPFVLMREIAIEQLDQFDSILKSEDYGNRVKKEAAESRIRFESDFHSSTGAIQQIYLDYYRQTVQLIKGQISRASADRKRYGRNSFICCGAMTRLDNLKVQHINERIKYLNCQKMVIESQINRQSDYHCDNEDSQNLEKQMSIDYHIQSIDIKIDILSEKYNLYKIRLDKVQSTPFEVKDGQTFSFQFYDTVESPEYFNLVEQQIDQIQKIKMEQSQWIKSKLIQIGQKNARLRAKKCFLKIQQSKLRYNSFDSDADSFQSVMADHSLSRSTTNQKLNRFRRETLNRLKRFKMKQIMMEQQVDKDLSQEKNIIQSNSNYRETDLINNNGMVVDESQPELVGSLTSPTFVTTTTLPPTTSVQLITPPPPPPPPPSSLLESKVFKIEKIKENVAKTQTSHSKTVGLIDLQELLNIRNKLKSTKDCGSKQNTPANQSNSGSYNDLLKSTLKQIRNVVCEDSDDNCSDYDEDQLMNSFED